MSAQAGAEAGVISSEFLGGDLRLVLGNDLAAVAGGQLALTRFCDHHGLDAGLCYRLSVIFEELVSNIVRHGFTPGSGQTLRVAIRATPNEIALTFEDDGPPFDPLVQEKPKAFSTLEDAKLGGLGIPLVLKLASSVRYEDAQAGSAQADFQPVNRLAVKVPRAG